MKKTIFYVAFASLAFGTIEIAVKTVIGPIPPITMTMLRCLIGGLFLMPFAFGELKKKGKKLKGQDWLWLALLGFINVVVSMCCYQLSIFYVKASSVAVLFSSNPIFILLLAGLILREPIRPWGVAAIVLQFCGILAMVNPWAEPISPAGLVFLLIGVVSFALYTVLGKKKIAEYGSMAVTSLGFVLGSLQLIVLMLLTHLPVMEQLVGTSWESLYAIPLIQGVTLERLPILLYASIAVTGCAYLCYFKAMEGGSTSMGALVFFFKPVVATLLAPLLIGEGVAWTTWLGVGFILLGSGCSIYDNSRKAKGLSPAAQTKA